MFTLQLIRSLEHSLTNTFTSKASDLISLDRNLIEILMVWKGGLASHGAAIAIIISMWIFSKKVTNKKTIWTLDKLVIAVALAAGFIRLGNLMNSEIVGVRTESESGFFYEYKAKNQIASFFSVESEKIHLNESEYLQLDLQKSRI